MFYELNTDPKTSAKYPWRVIEAISFHTGIRGYFYACPYFTFATNGVLTALPNYLFNGNTGLPLWLERFWLSMMLAGACMHDALYQLLVLGILPMQYRKTVDALLYSRWLSDGTPRAIALTGYSLVKSLGWIFILKEKK